MLMRHQGSRPLATLQLLFLIIVLASTFRPYWGDAVHAQAEAPALGNLAITIAPSILPADGRIQPVIYVQLMAPDGLPRLASQDIEIALFSSDPSIATIPEGIHIASGASFATGALTTTLVPGSAKITATSRGFAVTSAKVETVNGLEPKPPFRLTLSAAPANMLVGLQPPGRLSILLLGSEGRPISAPEDLEVILNSSNPDVVHVAERITIPKGEHFATTDVEPVGVGSAILSSVSTGFVSEFISIHVVEPGESPVALVLHLSPPVVRTGIGTHQGVILQTTDHEGTPFPFPCSQVHVVSSSPLSADISSVEEVACGTDSQYGTATLSIGDLPGRVTISAAATGLRPTATSLSVQGLKPTQLKASVAPEVLLTAEPTPGFVIVQVLDENGLPLTSHGDIMVSVTAVSSAVPRELVIPEGDSFARIALDREQLEDQAELWVANPELPPAHITLKSHILPAKVRVIAPGDPLFPGEQMQIVVRAESLGAPLAGAKISWTATKGTLSEATLETNENGEGRAVFTGSAPGDGLVEVSMAKVGYSEAGDSAIVSVVAPPDPSSSPAKLLGIPVLYLFLLIAALLVGYVMSRLLAAIKGRQS